LKKNDNWAIKLPKHEIEALARVILPEIQKYFESEQGKREFEEWRKGQAGKGDDGNQSA